MTHDSLPRGGHAPVGASGGPAVALRSLAEAREFFENQSRGHDEDWWLEKPPSAVVSVQASGRSPALSPKGSVGATAPRGSVAEKCVSL